MENFHIIISNRKKNPLTKLRHQLKNQVDTFIQDFIKENMENKSYAIEGSFNVIDIASKTTLRININSIYDPKINGKDVSSPIKIKLETDDEGMNQDCNVAITLAETAEGKKQVKSGQNITVKVKKEENGKRSSTINTNDSNKTSKVMNLNKSIPPKGI